MGASKDHITRLVRDFGALREALFFSLHFIPYFSAATPAANLLPPGLLRTAWTAQSELPNRNMTAVEIAVAIGRWDLVGVLNSEILYSISHSVLETLQTHFHNLIRSNLYARPHELALLRLPDLIVLTELELPMMWFPLKSEGPTKGARMKVRNSDPDTRKEETRKEETRKRVRVRPDVLRLVFPEVGRY